MKADIAFSVKTVLQKFLNIDLNFLNIFFTDAVRELLTHIPASIKSEPAASPAHALSQDLASESELTPLHMAAFSGSEAVVRALLNSSGVQVEGGCVPSVRIFLFLSKNALV